MRFLNDYFAGSRHREKDGKKATIYTTILNGEAQTRTGIQNLHGIRAATVSIAVQELVDDRLVIEGGAKRDGGKGRPEMLLYPNVNRYVAISIHNEYLMFYGNLINLRGESIARSEIGIPRDADNAEVLTHLSAMVHELRHLVPSGSQLTGIGISVIGMVDATTHRWISAHRWPLVRDLRLDALAEATGVPVEVRRTLDTELEYLLLDNPDTTHGLALLVHWGHGIGAAYAQNGRLLTSRFGKYADLGHMIVNPDNKRRCRCGRIGCVESEAAVWAMVDQIRSLHPTFSEDSQNAAAVLADPRLMGLPALRQAVDVMSLCLANAMKAFMPDYVFFVGPFFRNDIIRDTIIEYVSESVLDEARGQIRFEMVQHGFQGCTIGNVYSFFKAALRAPLQAKQ